MSGIILIKKKKQERKKNQKMSNNKNNPPNLTKSAGVTDRPRLFRNSDATSLGESLNQIQHYVFKSIITRLEFSLTAGQREESSIQNERPLTKFRIWSWQEHLGTGNIGTFLIKGT